MTPGQVIAKISARSIDTDFPITIKGRFGPKHMSGTIGRGGRRLVLETVNGSIELRAAS